ncbi:hypothetical protein FZI91_03980 [Mycobacterium sp. CBMA271]|uniref:hypothetical protein n=1 Tax=unclassified Mycobacteroides TaxID=2618759 RepID=UPI0012DBDC43|nr:MULTISPECIES: hypothetical protein [unclassified Mycobacteroides]MUM18278.1 hypothetical protein [Mycobacteroides sp. CBMA 326]MUM20865.1 hypothetical protein [Mycobacteroides sp. CBMA 271]
MAGDGGNKRQFDFRRFVAVWLSPVLSIWPWFSAAPAWFAMFCTAFFGLGWIVILRDGDLPGYRREPPVEYWMAVPWHWRADGDHTGVRVPLRYNPGPVGVAVLLSVCLVILAPAVIRVVADVHVFSHPAVGASTAKDGAMYFFIFYGSLIFGVVALMWVMNFLVDLPARGRSLLLSAEGIWVPGRQSVVRWSEVGEVCHIGTGWRRVDFQLRGRDGAVLAALRTQRAALPPNTIVTGLRDDSVLRAGLGEPGAAEEVNALVLGHAAEGTLP